MQQSNFIFGMMLLAFIVYITVKGQLQNYITLLRGGAPTGGTTVNAINSVLTPLSSILNPSNSSSPQAQTNATIAPINLNVSGVSNPDYLTQLLNAQGGN
jgi:hypothetical protein